MAISSLPVRHAVVPSAGRGTRFLPITKSVPKEMLPVVDRPSIEYIVREATNAGIDDMLLVTRSGKTAIEDYFDEDTGLEQALANKPELLAMVQEYKHLARMHTVRQGKPLGLGHAILQARQHVGAHPFAVLLPDDLIHPHSVLLKQMIAVRHALGGSVVALLKTTPEQATAYASTRVEPLPVPRGVNVSEGCLFRITEVVEKPPLEGVLSQYAVIGRFVFDPAIFNALAHTPRGYHNEYQLTDGYAQLIDTPVEDGGGLYGVVLEDQRFDTGDKLGYLMANVALALEDLELGPQIRPMIQALLD